MILVVSANLLFKEVILQAAAPLRSQCLVLDPDDAQSHICEHRPHTIIIDETIPEPLFEAILSAARSLPKTRTIVLNPKQNEILLLDSQRAQIRKVDDLLEAILSEPNNLQHSASNPSSSSAEDARALAGLFNFLAAMFNQRPDKQLVRRMRSIGVDPFLNLQTDPDSEDLSQGAQLIRNFIDATRTLPEDQVETDLAVDWTRLFRGVSPNYGPPPPYEAVYNQSRLSEVELLQTLSRLYTESGVEVGEDFRNRLDYLGLELAFLAYLAEQEAEAWETGNSEHASTLAEQAETFFRERLDGWAASFLTKALDYAKTDFYQGFLRLCRGVLNQVKSD